MLNVVFAIQGLVEHVAAIEAKAALLVPKGVELFCGVCAAAACFEGSAFMNVNVALSSVLFVIFVFLLANFFTVSFRVLPVIFSCLVTVF